MLPGASARACACAFQGEAAMPGARRKGSGSAGWQLQWGEGGVFKVDQEGKSFTDDDLEEWGDWMDNQFDNRFGVGKWPSLTVSTLNFSRNDLGDEGVMKVLNYLRKRNIAVQMVKLFKNAIGDQGAAAIGKYLAESREPVHEVHLSHNRITGEGACAIFEAIAKSKRYPYKSERSGRRDDKGLTPVWLRMEYNCIKWADIEHRLDPQQVRWCAADSRDGWGPKETSPMVCMHSSFRHQKEAENIPRKPSSASSNKSDAQTQNKKDEAAETSAEEEVPMYVFLDSSAVRHFAAERTTPKEALFSFQGLLNLCQQGHMKCTPPGDRQVASWLGPVEERDRLIFMVTDSVFEELATYADRYPGERRLIDWLRNAPDSYLQVCVQWGILEVLETRLHNRLVKLSGWEKRAQELQLGRLSLKNFDFAYLWESQIETEGRVLFVTADEALCTLASEYANTLGDTKRRVTTAHVQQLERVFERDREHGGWKLHTAAQKAKAPRYCGAVLSAQVMSSLVVQQREVIEGNSEVEVLRQELKEAAALVGDLRNWMTGPGLGRQQHSRCLERIDDAQKRWSQVLNQRF